MNNDTEKTKLNFKEGTLSKIIGAVIGALMNYDAVVVALNVPNIRKR